MRLRLLSYNIRYGGAGREKLLAAVIKACEPDLVVLQEATPDVVRTLASACGMKYWAASAGDSVAFLSRVAIEHYRWHRVLFARRRYLEILPAGNAPRIFGVHLSAIHSNLTEQRRIYELRSLLGQIEQYRHAFHLLMGDFNTLAPGQELDAAGLPPRLRALYWMGGGRIRWRTVPLMLERGYLDCYRSLHTAEPGYTFPAPGPHIRLDYLFSPGTFIDHVQRCEVVTAPPEVRDASDHLPLLSELDIQS